MDLPIATNSVSFANADAPPASGTPAYFTDGNPGTGTPATVLPGYWLNGIAEEIVTGLIAGAGITADRSTLTQVMQAVKRVGAGALSTISASATLTPDNAGLVFVSAAGGAVTLTLPSAAAVSGYPLRFIFVRTDSTSNTVTIACAGSDTFFGGGTSISLAAGESASLTSNGVSTWTRPLASLGGTAGQAFNVAAGTTPNAAVNFGQFPAVLASNGYQALPSGLIRQWGYGTITIAAATTWTKTSVTYPMAFPTACLNVRASQATSGVGTTVPLNSDGSTAINLEGFVLNRTTALTGFDVWGFDATETGRQDFQWEAIGH